MHLVELILVRHAIAQPHGTPGIEDDRRTLTDKGIRRMKRALRGLAALGVHLDEIWTSPLPRAAQTADILGALPGFGGRIRSVDALRPGRGCDAVGAALNEIRIPALALVGHEPDLGRLAGWLLCGRAGPLIELRKGGAAAFEVESSVAPGAGMLKWLLQPRALRRLALRKTGNRRRSAE